MTVFRVAHDFETRVLSRPTQTRNRRPGSIPRRLHQLPKPIGRLIVYVERLGGLLTVYNDGGIQYATRYGQVFARQGLSAGELKDLLAAFGKASIDTAAAVPDDAARMSGSRLMLAAARYQLVLTDLPPPTLAPVIGRMNLLKARAMSSARLVLRTGAARVIQSGEAAGLQEIGTALRTNTNQMR